jgi:hypothetical protein
MALVTFDIPEGLDPLIQKIKSDALELSDEYPAEVKDFLASLHTGSITCESIMAEKLGMALGIANLSLAQRIGRGVAEIQETITAIARAVWQVYKPEDKLFIIRSAMSAETDLDTILEVLVNAYGAPEAEIQGLITEVVSEETWESGLD